MMHVQAQKSDLCVLRLYALEGQCKTCDGCTVLPSMLPSEVFRLHMMRSEHIECMEDLHSGGARGLCHVPV